MTKEEAKRILYVFRAVILVDASHIEAFDMAIKALEQKPCEDSISRQIISDYVGNHIQEIDTGYGDLNKHTNKILRMIVDYIESMPPVTQQSRIGRWILNNNQGVQAVGYLTYHCSECGREISSKYHGKISLLKKYPYCHCGAKMQEVEE